MTYVITVDVTLRRAMSPQTNELALSPQAMRQVIFEDVDKQLEGLRQMGYGVKKLVVGVEELP